MLAAKKEECQSADYLDWTMHCRRSQIRIAPLGAAIGLAIGLVRSAFTRSKRESDEARLIVERSQD
jgi:hypothetical protein